MDFANFTVGEFHFSFEPSKRKVSLDKFVDGNLHRHALTQTSLRHHPISYPSWCSVVNGFRTIIAMVKPTVITIWKYQRVCHFVPVRSDRIELLYAAGGHDSYCSYGENIRLSGFQFSGSVRRRNGIPFFWLPHMQII